MIADSAGRRQRRKREHQLILARPDRRTKLLCESSGIERLVDRRCPEALRLRPRHRIVRAAQQEHGKHRVALDKKREQLDAGHSAEIDVEKQTIDPGESSSPQKRFCGLSGCGGQISGSLPVSTMRSYLLQGLGDETADCFIRIMQSVEQRRHRLGEVMGK